MRRPACGYVWTLPKGAQQAGEPLQPCVLVVQQCLDGREIEHRRRAPLVGVHRAQQRKERRLGLAACRGREHDAVVAVEDGVGGEGLHRPQPRKTKGMHDLVPQRGCQAIEGWSHDPVDDGEGSTNHWAKRVSDPA